MSSGMFDEVRILREQVIAQEEGRPVGTNDLAINAIRRICCILNDPRNHFGFIEWGLLVDDAYEIYNTIEQQSPNSFVRENLASKFAKLDLNLLLDEIKTARINSAMRSLEFVAHTYDMLRVGLYSFLRGGADGCGNEFGIMSRNMIYHLLFFRELSRFPDYGCFSVLKSRVGDAFESLLKSRAFDGIDQTPSYNILDEARETLPGLLGPKHSICYNDRYDRVMELIERRLEDLRNAQIACASSLKLQDRPNPDAA